ncbi:MAG: CarD family transcriptional regulator [Lachnospiraceae bacterium]|nr:CarD family transcriptional regulator [Lachnospiraceae bacterium]
MYKINEYVIYGMQGACKIKDIAEVDFSEKGKLYYKLIPEFDKNSEIYVSVQNGEKKMRSLISQEEATQMVADISNVKSRWISDDRERERAYKQAIFEGDYDEIIGIMAGLYEKRKRRKKQGKRQTELDDRIFRNTRNIFLGELAIALNTDIESIEKEIVQNSKL